MTIMMIKGDDNNWKANETSGEQLITIFETMHFREL